MKIKFFIVIALLIYCGEAASQQYKVELTEGLVGMKDPVNGGYMNFFDWQKSYGTLVYDATKNLITITEKTFITKYEVIRIEKKFIVSGCLTFILDCSQTTNGEASRTKVRLNLYENTPIGNVFISENDYSILAYKGTAALTKN